MVTAYVRGKGPGRPWRALSKGELPEVPEPFNTQWTHPEVGELWISWTWRSRPNGAWVPCAVRAAIQPTLFASVGEVGAKYADALREIGKLLKRDELDVPEVMQCLVVGAPT